MPAIGNSQRASREAPACSQAAYGCRTRMDEVCRNALRRVLLPRQPRAFPRRAESSQQCVDGQRDDAQHGDLAQRIQGTEVDGITLITFAPPPPGSAWSRKNGEMLSGAGRVSIAYEAPPCRRRVTSASTRSRVRRARARSDGRASSGTVRAWAASAARAGTERGDDLDDELRQCEIGRGEPYERQADDETDDAEHRQRSEAMKRRLPCSGDRARDADD